MVIAALLVSHLNPLPIQAQREEIASSGTEVAFELPFLVEVKPDPWESKISALKELQAETARREALERAEAERLAQVAREEANRAYRASMQPTYTSYGSLTGSYGYVIYYGNCVNQAPYHLRASGNPISWPPTSGPYIGGIALFHYNHVARITGFWSNGDIEVAHENYKGNQTRFPRSAFRGYR